MTSRTAGHFDQTIPRVLRSISPSSERSRATRGTLRKLAVRHDGRVLGWCLFYVKSAVLADRVAARPKIIGDVLDHCFYDAWRQGTIAMSGQLDCRLKRHFGQSTVVFRDSGTRVLVNAKDPELLQVLCRGNCPEPARWRRSAPRREVLCPVRESSRSAWLPAASSAATSRFTGAPSGRAYAQLVAQPGALEASPLRGA